MTKKKILIMGAGGMAGSMIYQYLSSLNKYEMYSTYRHELDIEENSDSLYLLIDKIEPYVIVNCIGILVEESQAFPLRAVYVNGMFPHLLESLTRYTSTKIIHLSTDCIFNGDLEYSYNEIDFPTETNWYGRSKALGELNNNKDLTLRLSIIGPQLKAGPSLFHWITTTKESSIKGFNRVSWNGITTLELAKQIDRIISYPLLTGIYNLASEEIITKYDLLELINTIFKCNKHIEKQPDQVKYKVLCNNRIYQYDPKIPNYKIQLEELKSWIESKIE